jgi:hypothetical protein
MNYDPLILLAISCTLNAVFLGAWVLARRRIHQLENRDSLRVPPTETDADRLGRTVEALAAQLEQVANSQDFLNRVVTERLDKIARALPEGKE